MKKLKPKAKRKKRQKGLGPQRRWYPERKPTLSVTIRGLPRLHERINAHVSDVADALRVLSTAGLSAAEAAHNLRSAFMRVAPVATYAGLSQEETRAILNELIDDYIIYRPTLDIEAQLEDLYESTIQEVRVIRFRRK